MTPAQKLAATVTALLAALGIWVASGKPALPSSSPKVAYHGECKSGDTLIILDKLKLDTARVKNDTFSYVPARGTPEGLALDSTKFVFNVGDTMVVDAVCVPKGVKLKPVMQ